MSVRKKSRPLFQTILVPQFFVLALLVLILVLSMPISSLGDTVTRNYQNVVSLQTAHQGDYLTNFLDTGRQEVTVVSKKAVNLVQSELDNQTLTMKQLNTDSAYYTPLLHTLSTEMITGLSLCRASGIYVIFNSSDPDELISGESRPCLYIRSYEHDSGVSTMQSSDSLSLLYAPESLCRKLLISKDEAWQPSFRLKDTQQQSYFYDTFQNAYQDKVRQNGSAYGFWSVTPYQVSGSERFSLSYSEPLILENGTVIGIVGIEFLVDHLSHFLPSGALLESKDSGYVLAVSPSGSPMELTTVINGSSDFLSGSAGDSFVLSPLQIGGYSLMDNDREFYTDISYLDIYSEENTSGLSWYLVGVVGMNEMFSFANEMTRVILLTILLTLLVGIVSVITVSFRLTRPIVGLSSEVEDARKTKSTEFTATGICEIDQLSDAFRELMQETVDTSTKFLNIMEMASVELAGYEWREGNDSVYVTSNFFPMLGMDHIDTTSLRVPEFKALLQDIRSNMGASITLDGSRLYRVNRDGNVRYVRAESTQADDRHIGLLEDVTRSALERFRIEHERDHDMLTGLYNRRAFYNRARHLFANPEKLHCAALLVLDIDNLKTLNTRYGHDYGDRYLQKTSHCIMEHLPNNALCARISGDELYLFFYNYNDRRKLRGDIVELMNTVSENSLQLPDNQTLPLSVTGGFALYPDNSTYLHELVKYADFAMYQAKSTRKGSLKLFNEDDYAKNETFNRGRDELKKMIDQELVTYHFQPIFSAETARPAAYEALMRVNMPSIKSPDVVLRLAAAEGSQYQIERITMFKASTAFRTLLENGQVSDDAMLFINSQPDQCLTEKDAQLFHEAFASIQDRIVLEITEDEYLGLEALEVKRRYPGFSGYFALDDYGSGYNGEKNLLQLQPRFIKVDVVLIRGIDSNPDRQQLISGLVSYAHGRGMKVVAEGIETAGELRGCLELGVDLFQGYFLARPAEVPAKIAPQAEEIILNFQASK